MPLASVLSEVTTVVGHHGLYAVFLLMLVDAVLPAASEAVMVYGGAVAAGAFASQHVVLFGTQFDPGAPAYVAMALAGTIGYTLGSIGGWAIGRYGGRPFVERHGRWLHVDARRLARADRWFERYGDLLVLFGRLTPVVRSFVAIPAGLGQMRVLRYTLLTLPGSALWCFGLAAAGWALGASWDRFHERFRYVDYGVAALVVAAAAVLVLRWRSSRLARRAGAASR